MSEGKLKEFISKEEVQKITRQMASRIQSDYEGIEQPLIVVGLLKGSFIFMADLVRELDLDIRCEFMAVSSYGDNSFSSGHVRIQQDLDISIEDRDVLLVEDIVDTGRTFSALVELLNGRHPRSLKTCSLLDKPDRRVIPIKVDYVGRMIPDEFVVGYGLDYAGQYRNLPYVGILEVED